ncbi:NAD/FAD-utilizing enzyme [Shewanella sp. UCD-KL12]|uniref:NAD/FAD-utilizing enzyme n=1 Tax=Shewanella sp. UCD-KL12 TaxID=1917163 RepID=UPI000970F99A|nr:NAD/FAD-utilizing enzyme [Shewanella sp. UCD-KL12]
MLRHYFISSDLDELEAVEHELEAEGINEPQIHVLSESCCEFEDKQQFEVESVLEQDVQHSADIGSIIGLIVSATTLMFAYQMGWTTSEVGWLPFIFLGIVILGFCTWEGSFIGLEKNHIIFERFEQLLHQGQHVLIVDVNSHQEPVFAKVINGHPRLEAAGLEKGLPFIS